MARRVIALDAGGTKLLAGIVDEELTDGWRRRTEWNGADVLEEIAAGVAAGRAAAPDAGAVGIGIPARVRWPEGVSVGAAHLPLGDVAIADGLRERVGLPVHVDNDANLAALAEHRAGAARGASNAVMLTVGTGIGAGLVLGGRLYRGSTGAAGEIGHMTIDFDGPPCAGDCPGRGCFETYVSGPALAAAGIAAAERHPESALAAAGGELDGARVTREALAGDPAAAEAVADVGRRLGAGIAALLNVFDPEVVVVGGGVAAAGELLLGPARATARERALDPAARRARIEPAQLGDEAGMIGAGLLALAGGVV